jgi:hypothetical protein
VLLCRIDLDDVEDHLRDGADEEEDEPPPQDQEDFVVHDVQPEDTQGADALLTSTGSVSK